MGGLSGPDRSKQMHNNELVADIRRICNGPRARNWFGVVDRRSGEYTLEKTVPS